MPAASSPLFERLRGETRAEHKLIEATLPVLNTVFDQNAYIKLLTKFLGFYRPYEEKLAMVGLPSSFNYDIRKKSPLLERDLFNFEIEEVALCKGLPSLGALPSAIGALYVTEGATLGGKIISQHLKSVCGLDDIYTNFFRGYGKSTGEMWSRFRAATDSIVKLEDHDDIIRSAKQTFDSLRGWLETA